MFRVPFQPDLSEFHLPDQLCDSVTRFGPAVVDRFLFMFQLR